MVSASASLLLFVLVDTYFIALLKMQIMCPLGRNCYLFYILGTTYIYISQTTSGHSTKRETLKLFKYLTIPFSLQAAGTFLGVVSSGLGHGE